MPCLLRNITNAQACIPFVQHVSQRHNNKKQLHAAGHCLNSRLR